MSKVTGCSWNCLKTSNVVDKIYGHVECYEMLAENENSLGCFSFYFEPIFSHLIEKNLAEDLGQTVYLAYFLKQLRCV